MAFDLDEDELKATRKMNKADRNEIEVGEYVRTENGIIDKVDSLCGMIENTVYLKQQSLWFNMDYIVKHSKQLIGVIECEDFVNGMEILHIDDNKLYVEWSNEFEEFTGFLKNKDIKTILTKEQYMANCYKVGGEDK